MKTLRALFYSLFSNYRWARRLHGGKWERWYITNPVCANVWHPVDEWSHVVGRPPTALCREPHYREEY